MKDMSFYRIGLLFKRYFRENWKKDVIVAAIIFVIEMLFSFDCTNSTISSLILIVFALIYSGRTFVILGRNQGAVNYIMIPASTEEKGFVNICLSQFYYPLMLVAASCLGILASTFTCAFLFDCELTLKHISLLPGGEKEAETIAALIVLFMMYNSIMLFGSVFFRKTAVIKTLLWGALFFVAISILCGIMFKILLSGGYSIFNGGSLLGDNFGLIITISSALLTVFFWFLTFFRLKETEA